MTLQPAIRSGCESGHPPPTPALLYSLPDKLEVGFACIAMVRTKPFENIFLIMPVVFLSDEQGRMSAPLTAV